VNDQTLKKETTMVSYDELVANIRKILPDAKFSENECGELVIITNVIEENGEIISVKQNR